MSASLLPQPPASLMATANDYLTLPSDSGHHGQEATSYSVTDTIVGGHHHERSKTMASGTSEFEAVLSDGTAVSSPGDYSKPNAPPPRATFSGNTCPPVIPPPGDRPFRTLVLCFDGTGDQFDLDNSNIVQFVSLLQKDNRAKQMVYYQVRGYAHSTSNSDSKLPFRLESGRMRGRTLCLNLGFRV